MNWSLGWRASSQNIYCITRSAANLSLLLSFFFWKWAVCGCWGRGGEEGARLEGQCGRGGVGHWREVGLDGTGWDRVGWDWMGVDGSGWEWMG